MNILENTLQQLHSRAPRFNYRSHDDEEIAIHYEKLLQSIRIEIRILKAVPIRTHYQRKQTKPSTASTNGS